MSDLVAFLRAQYDVAEARARAADGNSWSFAVLQGTYSVVSDGYLAAEALDVGSTAIVAQGRTADASQRMMHIALNDPAYVLADIAAKRQILDEHRVVVDGVDEGEVGPGWVGMPQHQPRFGCHTCHVDDRHMYDGGYCQTLRLLAQPFRAHPDYDPAWAVGGS